jgi:excisionase family DNA binding protein
LAPLFRFSCGHSSAMSPSTSDYAPHLGTGSRYGPTPAASGRAGRPPPATAPPAQEQPWPRDPEPDDRPDVQPPSSPLDLASCSGPPAILSEVLTARECVEVLRLGKNQLYQAVPRGELCAVRIGPSIRIPKQALVDLLATGGPGTATGDE